MGDLQGVEAPWPLVTAQKYTQRRNQEPEDTNRCRDNKGEEEDAQGTWGQITRRKPLGISRGLGHRLRSAVGGAYVRVTEEGRGREVTS